MKITTTIVDETGKYYKFLKLVPYKSGGFAVIFPKLINSDTGRLEKTYVAYENYGTRLHIKRDESEQYGVGDIVKFSYHADGFVQFSSATNSRIKSGRKPDGTIKGLGLLSWPLNNPIATGPSMTISFCGLSGFIEVLPERVDNSFIFDIREATKHPKATFMKNEKVAYAMALYVIPNSAQGEITNINGKKYANLSMMQSLPDGSAFMRLREKVRIIEIPNQSYKIAASWFTIPNKFKFSSGYIFMGPTDGKKGLMASYPATDYGNKLLMKDLLP